MFPRNYCGRMILKCLTTDFDIKFLLNIFF